MLDILLDALLDSLRLLPFLYLTYLFMEFMEHKMSAKVKSTIRNAGKYGPAAGAVLGAFPQCGFSAAAANLYAGRIITLGTLIAIFLSTSDEMLPILIMNRADISLVLTLVGTKMIIGLIAGFVIDAVVSRKKGQMRRIRIGNMCEQDRCNCSRNIWLSALKHTGIVITFIFIITFALAFVMETVGEDAIAAVVGDQKILAPIIAGVIGLIPNCASSVALTQLYVSGVTGMGTLLAGLLAGSGVGVLVLFRINKNIKENVKILGMIYGIGVVVGIIINFF